MADQPKPAARTAGKEPFKELTEESLDRLSQCEAQKREFDRDIREAYFFTAPHRARELRSAQATSPSKPDDAGELQTGIAMEYSKDFATVLLNAFMPEAEPWAEQRPGMFIPDKFKEEARKQAKEQDPKIFEAIRASNLYQEMPKSFNPDASVGVAAISIDDLRPSENIVVQAIPLHELEINLGPFGSLDDRFVVRHTKNRHVKALLTPAIFDKLTAEARKNIEDNPKNSTIIRWGYWRLWDRRDDVVWQHVVMLDNKVVHEATLVGEGSCPLIPMRFNPSPEWAYAAGPAIESLPDLRQLDELRIKKFEHIDNTLAPPMGFPDDSMASAEGGLRNGKFYPIRPGTEGAIKKLIETGSIEPAIYEEAQFEQKLRHRFFLDWPEQRGDTPPTATQWLDEMQLAQRRIGTPGASFWREGPAEIFLRFKHILQRRGVIEQIVVDGKTVSLQPYNPAQRAAEQQEVAMAGRYLALVMPTFPEEARLKVDGSATMEAMAEKMRVTKIVKFRTEQVMGNVIEGIKQLSEGRQQIRPGDPAAVGQQ